MSLLLQSPRNIRITEVSQQLSLQVRFILQRYHRGVGTSTRRAQYLVRSYRYLSKKPYDPIHDYSLSHNNEKSILVCGDGDLSFGASLSNGLLQSRPGVKLVASVLESQEQHNRGTSLCMYDMTTREHKKAERNPTSAINNECHAQRNNHLTYW